MLTNYNQVVQIVNRMNTEQVSQAEADLSALAKQDNQVIACLHDLLKDTTQADWVHIIAASNINRLICDNEVGIELEQVAKWMMEILVDLDIDPAYKRVLERSIVHIIDNIDQPLLTAFRENVFVLMQDQKLRDTLYLFIACWAVPKIDVQHVIYLYNVALQHTLSRFVTFSNTDLAMAKEYNEIIKTWNVVWDALQRSDESNAEKVMLDIVNEQAMCDVILGLYEWMAHPPLIICTSEPLAELNILKNEAVELHLHLLSKSVEFRKKYSQTSKIFELTEGLMMRVMQNLQIVSTERERLDDFMCKELAINLIKLLRTFLEGSPSSFSKIWMKVFFFIVIPYMQVDSDELEKFQEDPEGFIALEEDCAEKQTFEILKTESCKLLQRMADKSEKITQNQFIPNFAIRFAVDSIMAHAGLQISNNYEFPLTSIENALTIIGIFSYRVKDHEAEVKDLYTCLTRQFLIQQSPMVRAKLYIFMGYCYEDIYVVKEQGGFWIESALQESGHPTVIKCCLDFMNNVADEFYSDYFFQALIERMEVNTDGALWDTLGKLVTTQSAFISEPMMQMFVNKIFYRLALESKQLSSQEVKKTVTMINMVQLLATVAGLPSYCEDKPNLKFSIWDVTSYLGLASSYHFEDEILEIVFRFLRQENDVQAPYRQVLHPVLEIFKKDYYCSKICVLLINEFIMKDSSRECLPSIFKTLITAMMTYLLELTQKTKNKKVKPIMMGYLLILLQNFTFHHREVLGDNQIYQISALATQMLNKEQTTDKVLLARSLNLLLLCHMQRSDTETWNTINKYCQNEEVFFGYDVQVFQSIVEIEIFKESNMGLRGAILGLLAQVVLSHKKRKEKEKKSKQIRKQFSKEKSRIRLNRYLDYQTEIKKMTIPFNMNNSEKRFIELVKHLRDAHGPSFGNLFEHTSQQHKKAIMELENVTDLNNGQARRILTIVRPKEIAQVDEDEERADRKDLMEESEEEGDLKRERKLEKELKKKKKKTRMME